MMYSHAILIYLACSFPGVADHWWDNMQLDNFVTLISLRLEMSKIYSQKQIMFLQLFSVYLIDVQNSSSVVPIYMVVDLY